MAPRWEINRVLARSCRPGYTGEQGAMVQVAAVDAWVRSVKEFGVVSIICLLHEEHLKLYAALPDGLLSYYKSVGFNVAHVEIKDHQNPPVPAKDLERVWSAFDALPQPVLVHCSAGVDRTGSAVTFIRKQLAGAA